MTKRDFFRLIIKVFGLYSMIVSIFYFLPTNIGYIISDFALLPLIGSLFAILLLIGLCVLLIRKADKIIDTLKLDKGFDDTRIEIGNFNNLGIMKFALILISGFLIIDYLPDFLHYCLLAFKNRVSRRGLDDIFDQFTYQSVDSFQWIVSGINILLGYIILTNYNKIAVWLIRKDIKNE